MSTSRWRWTAGCGDAAGRRCGYCLSPQHLVMARLEIEHVVPLAAGVAVPGDPSDYTIDGHIGPLP